MRKVEKILEKSRQSIDINKAKSGVCIEELKTQNRILAEENKVLELQTINTRLKHQNSIVNTLKRNGVLVGCLGVLSFFASTSLSLAGGYKVLSKTPYMFWCFALVLVVAQLIIFVSAKFSTVVNNKFFQHYNAVKTMQVLMLFVSFVMNIIFFHEVFRSVLMDIIMSPLCFVLDYSTIVFSNLGYDMKTLNTETKKKGVLAMWIDNKFWGFQNTVHNTYNKNHNTSLTPIETPQNTLLTPIENPITPLKTNRCFEIEKHINEKYTPGQAIEIEKIKTQFSLTRKEWDTIRKHLNNIEIKGKRTFRKGEDEKWEEEKVKAITE